MSITHVAALRNDLANLVVGNSTTFASGSSHKLKIYSGAPPANASAALSGNTVLATISGITWGAASSGIATVAGSTGETNAAAGTATFFRLYQTAGADPANVILQGTVGTSGTDLVINNTTIAAGASVSLTGTNTYTAPN